MALQEIGLITTRAYKYSPLAVIGGDCNYPPAQGPDPDYSTMHPYNLAARTLLSDPTKNVPRTPDRRQSWKLAQAGFVDVAYHLFEKTGDKGLLERTASDDRIDQFWVSQPLAAAILNYWVISKPDSASDHKGVVFQLDTDLIDIPK
jgi:exonuclease III